jgi:hypothetical protein
VTAESEVENACETSDVGLHRTGLAWGGVAWRASILVVRVRHRQNRRVVRIHLRGEALISHGFAILSPQLSQRFFQ